MEVIMTVIKFIIAGVVLFLKICAALAILGVVLLLFVIAREVAWTLRQENKRKMEEKKKNEDGGV